MTSEATLCRLALLLLFMKKTSGLETLDKSRRTWCEETEACARCGGKNYPRCSKGAEPLQGADICGCCSSCVALRDSGESCGSQFHVWSNSLDADSVSSMTILATTRCREGLVCLNSVCHDSGVNLEPTSSSLEQILASHDEDNVYLTKKTQPCYAKSEQTISSFPFDEPLGRLASIDRGSKRFGVVYTGEFRNEMELLLGVIDAWQEDFLVDEESLISDFMESSTVRDFERVKRELEPPPNNIRDILIRGASAHQEYVGGAQNQVPETEVSNGISEIMNQGDESTVRVQISTLPGKVQTVIDVEAGDGAKEPEVLDLGKIVGSSSPAEPVEGEVYSSMLLDPLPTTAIAKLGPVETTQILNKNNNNDNSLMNGTLTKFSDRLSLVEARVDLLGRVLEEMGRYTRPQVFFSRDCFLAQNSDLSFRRRAPDPEEHLALSSALDAVRVPEGRRRLSSLDRGLLGYRGWNEPRRQNPFRTLINDGYLPRGRWGPSACKHRPNLRSARDVTSTNPLPQETQVQLSRDVVLPSWKMFIFDGEGKGSEEEEKKLTKRAASKLFDGDGEESPVRTASGRLLFRDSDTPQLTTEPGPANADQGLHASNSYSITNRGNSRIRIEEIGADDYDESMSQFHGILGPSSSPEDDFDRILGGEEEDGGFDYEHVEYPEPNFEQWDKPETGLNWDAIRSALHGRESDLRNRRNDARGCGEAAKRETPLLLSGSTGTNDPKTILWPSRWAGYRRDETQEREQKTSGDRGFEGTEYTAIAATKPTPESLITGDGIKDGGSRTVATKTSGFERRGRKNRRKLVWR